MWLPMPEQQNQAYSDERLTVFEHGKTGAGLTAVYDGSGSAAEGGDNRAAAIADGFLSSRYAKDLCQQAMWNEKTQKVRTGPGTGMAVEFRMNDQRFSDIAYLDGTVATGSVKLRGGNWRIPRP